MCQYLCILTFDNLSVSWFLKEEQALDTTKTYLIHALVALTLSHCFRREGLEWPVLCVEGKLGLCVWPTWRWGSDFLHQLMLHSERYLSPVNVPLLAFSQPSLRRRNGSWSRVLSILTNSFILIFTLYFIMMFITTDTWVAHVPVLVILSKNCLWQWKHLAPTHWTPTHCEPYTSARLDRGCQNTQMNCTDTNANQHLIFLLIY